MKMSFILALLVLYIPQVMFASPAQTEDIPPVSDCAQKFTAVQQIGGGNV